MATQQRVRALLLATDKYSPMSEPHALPALHWPGLAKGAVEASGIADVEALLAHHGWAPQWRFGMYKQAHYHSTTHELLTVVKSSATIQLGGTDERAHPQPRGEGNASDAEKSSMLLELGLGDVLLLPAGYTHRSIESQPGFTMIGSYPAGAEQWDMRFPNVMGCPHDVKKIEHLTRSAPRKGLFKSASPETFFKNVDRLGDVDTQWKL